jgi:hypothetical protein
MHNGVDGGFDGCFRPTQAEAPWPAGKIGRTSPQPLINGGKWRADSELKNQTTM